jgi:hypothetical protein
MDYDSNYWKNRILAKYTTSLTRQDIIDSFKSHDIEVNQEAVDMANSYLLHKPYQPTGKQLSYQDVIDKINHYAKVYSFSVPSDVRLFTLEELSTI